MDTPLKILSELSGSISAAVITVAVIYAVRQIAESHKSLQSLVQVIQDIKRDEDVNHAAIVKQGEVVIETLRSNSDGLLRAFDSLVDRMKSGHAETHRRLDGIEKRLDKIEN